MNAGRIQTILTWLRNEVTVPRLDTVLRWLTRLLHGLAWGFAAALLCYFVFRVFIEDSSPPPEYAGRPEYYDDLGGDYVWMMYAAMGFLIAAFWTGITAAALLLCRTLLSRAHSTPSHTTP